MTPVNAHVTTLSDNLHLIPQAAQLYWQAFGGKLGKVLAPEDKALALIEKVINPACAMCVVSDDGELLGVAGFKTLEDGGFIEGIFKDMREVYGLPTAIWRAIFLSLLYRKAERGTFQLDGIFVRDTARGMGVGGTLLAAVDEETQRRGLQRIKLDVIDTNPRARALYERKGFVATKVTHLGPLKYVFGFNSATTMVKHVSP